MKATDEQINHALGSVQISDKREVLDLFKYIVEWRNRYDREIANTRMHLLNYVELSRCALTTCNIATFDFFLEKLEPLFTNISIEWEDRRDSPYTAPYRHAALWVHDEAEGEDVKVT